MSEKCGNCYGVGHRMDEDCMGNPYKRRCNSCGGTGKKKVWRPKDNPCKEIEMGETVDHASREVNINHACNLLAVMHGDGGHYIQEHGFEKACKDAEQVRHDLVSKVDSLKFGFDKIGKWLSTALDDPKVCNEMKANIRAAFELRGKNETT